MINTLSDFLYELIKFEKEFLDNNKIKHPPTIGKMYEGLTGSILNKILFDGIDLRIIKNSFIKGCDTEFDVLIVEGDGDKLPYQESYIYPADQIIAIISVKKKIYSSDLKDGFANLQFIVDS